MHYDGEDNSSVHNGTCDGQQETQDVFSSMHECNDESKKMAYVCSMVAAAIRPADSTESSNLVEKKAKANQRKVQDIQNNDLQKYSFYFPF